MTDTATTIDPTGAERGRGVEERLAKGLGWFSIALGVPQLVAPRRFARLIGVADTARNRRLLRLVGARELGGALGILDRPRPSGFLLARVAGDLMDLLLLRNALGTKRNAKRRVGAAIAAVAGVTVLDAIASAKTSRSADPTTSGGAVRVRSAVTVNRSPGAAYAFWRHLQNLPRFMAHLESVDVDADGRSHWVAKGPAGSRVEWDATIVEDVSGQVLSWRSDESSSVPNSGFVRFTPAPGGGTEVTVDLEVRPPLGAVGAAAARLFGEDPEQQVRDDLRRFKQVIETGEVARSDASPDGSRTQRQFRQPPAQPGE